MRSLISCIVLFISTLNLTGQATLSGKVSSLSQEPIEYATVSIYPLSDSTHIRGAITNNLGTFSFSKLKPRSYQVTIQMLGYKDWTQEVFGSRDIALDNIILEEESALISEVVIVAAQSSLESHLGKKVLRIGQDLASTGSNVLEALETIPSVTTTPRGQIQIRGNSNVVIYINGKETKRDPATLKFITAESLEKIEIITNPSAEYDAEGVGGIINLVYSKGQNNSLKLDLISNLSILTDPLYLSPNSGFNLSWSQKKFTAFTNLNYDYGYYEDHITSKRTNYFNELEYYENLSNQKGLGKITNSLVGISMEPDTTSSFGLEASFVRWDLLNEIQQQNNFRYKSSDTRSITINNDRGEVEDELWIALSYEKEFRKKQTVKFSFTVGGENESNFTKSGDGDLSNEPVHIENFVRSSNEIERQRYYHGKVDYEMPVSKWGTIKAGSKLDLIGYHIFQELQLISDDIKIPDNDFDMDMQKLSLYLIQQKKIKKFEYAIGVRLEQFKSEAFQHSNQEKFTQEYASLFPSLQATYLIKDHEQTIGFNYTRRINRPGFFDLNPFVSYQDPLNLETGNPALEPEIADLVELNYHKDWSQLNVDLTAYYRKTNNSIQDIITPLDVNRTLSSYVNIGSEMRRGLELQLEYRPHKIFKTTGTFVFAQSEYEDTENEINFNNQQTWSLRLKQECRLKNNWRLELSEIYRAPSYQIQQKTHENYYIDLGVSKKFDNKRGSISLAIRDLFNTREFITSLHASSFEVERSYKWQTRQITLGVKYTIIDMKI